MSEEIKIESGIPTLSSNGRPLGLVGKALSKMKIGDSFVVPKTHSLAGVYSSAKQLKIKVSIRAIGADPLKIFRVWRIK